MKNLQRPPIKRKTVDWCAGEHKYDRRTMG